MATIRMKEEIEITRHNVTPSQFLAYVRQQIKKHGMTAVTADEIDLDYFRGGYDIEFDYHDIPGKPCKAEKSVSKPYQMQTYILNWDGTVYNFIMEFSFDDDKTGYGYFYFINTWDREGPQEETKEEEKNLLPVDGMVNFDGEEVEIMANQEETYFRLDFENEIDREEYGTRVFFSWDAATNLCYKLGYRW